VGLGESRCYAGCGDGSVCDDDVGVVCEVCGMCGSVDLVGVGCGGAAGGVVGGEPVLNLH
jgi:hypothetical protein